MIKQQSGHILTAKPFVKWAGGKRQLLKEIIKKFPYGKQERFTYIEPFVGSGAVLFWVLEHFQNIQTAIINDISPDLILAYQTIRDHCPALITHLQKYQNEYHSLLKSGKEEKTKAYYYAKRTLFNKRKSHKVTQTALFIFLNRTCFNGLYRVNQKNQFNVPIGSYKSPKICDTYNLLAVSEKLKKVQILQGDFEQTKDYADKNGKDCLFYLDPPYKPLSSTALFTSYAQYKFNDKEQIRLKQFCDQLDASGYRWIASNSDVKEIDINNNFFDELYANYYIKRVQASRRINATPQKRGFLSELLITNYQ